MILVFYVNSKYKGNYFPENSTILIKSDVINYWKDFWNIRSETQYKNFILKVIIYSVTYK